MNPQSINHPISNVIRINGDSASPEAQDALQRIAANLAAQGIHLEEETFDRAQEVDILTRLSALEVQAQVQPSRMPLIGPLITRIKQAVHQLVLFYVRDLAAQQNAFNAQLVHILDRDVRDVPAARLYDR